MIQLDYRDARPIYIQITDCFREQIAAGILRPDEKLPSVRDLACQLTINPNTIQRAYRELENEGWIASVAGKGSFVCGIPDQIGAERKKLLEKMDHIVQDLLSCGVTREMLIQRIGDGGKNHA